MFKKDLGISVYPEHFSKQETIDYIKKCFTAGFKKIFLSLIHLPTNTDANIIKLYKDIIKEAKVIGYYVILDIAEVTFELLDYSSHNLGQFKDLKVDCLRLDSPLLPKEVADATYQGLDIQINMSNNDTFVNNIIDYRPKLDNLSGSHNFYPLPESAVSFEFFKKATKRFLEFNLHTSAFIGSHFGIRGPQKEKVGALVTFEELRSINIRSQAKVVFATNLISTVLVGNQPMNDQEIKELSSVTQLLKTEFDIKLEQELSSLEKEILMFDNHFWRGDANETFIRSTQPRVAFKMDNTANNCETELNYGDVCIVNQNNSHYQNELVIILKNNYHNQAFNKIGSIHSDDIILLKQLKPWDRFSFRVVE